MNGCLKQAKRSCYLGPGRTTRIFVTKTFFVVGLSCTAFVKSLALALDGFDLYTVHELSSNEKELGRKTSREKISRQSRDSNARTLSIVLRPPPPPSCRQDLDKASFSLTTICFFASQVFYGSCDGSSELYLFSVVGSEVKLSWIKYQLPRGKYQVRPSLSPRARISPK